MERVGQGWTFVTRACSKGIVERERALPYRSDSDGDLMFSCVMEPLELVASVIADWWKLFP